MRESYEYSIGNGRVNFRHVLRFLDKHRNWRGRKLQHLTSRLFQEGKKLATFLSVAIRSGHLVMYTYSLTWLCICLGLQ